MSSTKSITASVTVDGQKAERGYEEEEEEDEGGGETGADDWLTRRNSGLRTTLYEH